MRGHLRLVLAVVAALAVAGTLGGVSATRLQATPPPAAVHLGADPSLALAPGVAPPVVQPAAGSLVVEGLTGPRLAGLAPDSVRAIGSVAKTMTALVVLEARPLHGGDGPTLTMTEADVALYRETIAADGSALAVTAGERLTERQVLLGLMLPSANNLAETLAIWVGGTRAAFLAQLNRRAAQLGMTATHFDDPSGYSPRTVSTASDLVRLGRAALADGDLAAIVATPQATLPDGTVLHNLDSLLVSQPGWLGIKTGETPSAGACLLFAARRAVGTAAIPVTVVGAVLGQPHLPDALEAARRAAESALDGYVEASLPASPPGLVATVTSAWGATTSGRVGGLERRAVVVRAGAVLLLTTVTLPGRVSVGAGDRLGEVDGTFDGAVVARWTVVAAGPVEAPSPWWRLLHG